MMMWIALSMVRFLNFSQIYGNKGEKRTPTPREPRLYEIIMARIGKVSWMIISFSCQQSL
jgi:hypothetical protein